MASTHLLRKWWRIPCPRGVLLVVQVIGFDLDDTLLRLSSDFIPTYMKTLSLYMDERFPDKAPLADAFLTVSARMMQKTRDSERLEDFFYRVFEENTGLSRDDIERPLQEFYAGPFARLEHLSSPVFGITGLLATLRAKGYRVALLTSALFPKKAIDWRLKWAGLEGFGFDWRTSLEAVHATKPQPDYYREAAEMMHSDPSEWLMVGNDLIEDIVPAHAAGMAVWWAQAPLTPQEIAKLPIGAEYGPIHRVIPWLSSHAHG